MSEEGEAEVSDDNELPMKKSERDRYTYVSRTKLPPASWAPTMCSCKGHDEMCPCQNCSTTRERG